MATLLLITFPCIPLTFFQDKWPIRPDFYVSRIATIQTLLQQYLASTDVTECNAGSNPQPAPWDLLQIIVPVLHPQITHLSHPEDGNGVLREL